MDDRDGSTRDGTDPPAVHPRTQDALLDHYAEMRADVRAHATRKTRRLLQAIVALAAVLALAYVGRSWVVSVVPVVLTFLFLAHVAAENRAFRRTRQAAAVERLLDVPGVDYEREYGARSERASRLHDRIPLYALAGCFFLAWAGSIAAGLAAFHRSPPTFLDGPVSVAVPAAVYLVLVALVTLGTWSYLATRSEPHADDTAADESVADESAADAPGRDQRRLDEFAGVAESAADAESDDADEGEPDEGDAATDVDPATNGAADDGDATDDPGDSDDVPPDGEPSADGALSADEPAADGEPQAEDEASPDDESPAGDEATADADPDDAT